MSATDSALFAGALAVVVGVNIAVQSRINGALGHRLGDGVYAALISFATGLLCAVVAVCASPRARAGFRATLPAVRRRGLRWWELLGGLGGALFVTAQGVTVPVLGVALFTVCIVAGQTGNSLLVDRLGLAHGGVRRVTPARIVAALLTVVAVVIGVSDRWDVGDFRVLFVVLVVAAGAAAAFQQAFNSQVARVAESVSVSSLVNFIVGFAALFVIVAVAHLASGKAIPSLPPLFSSTWWLYLGGPMGFAYTVGLALVVRTLGVLLFGLCAIAGQLSGAVLIDVVAPTSGASVTWQLIVAVGLTFAAVLLAGLSSRRSAADVARDAVQGSPA